MKILIPNFRSPDSFVDNVAYTLEQMNIEVETMPNINRRFYENKVWQLFRIIQQTRKGTKFWENEKWLIKKLSKPPYPNILLCLTQSISEEILLLCQDKGIITVAWWGDPPSNMIGKGLVCNGWDIIYLKDKHAAKKLNGLGLNAHLLHEAMNPVWHKPTYKKIENHLTIAGTFYDYRNYLTKKLLDAKIPLRLYGRKLPNWVYPNIEKTHTNTFVTKEKKSEAFGQALACINSTSMREFDSLNCRAFEIAGTKGLQFFEHRPVITECFEINKEIKVFHSVEELIELYYWAKKYPDEALKVREKGYQRALAEHTYQHRLEKIISDIT